MCISVEFLLLYYVRVVSAVLNVDAVERCRLARLEDQDGLNAWSRS